jgi:hypothetical protein
MAVRHRVGVRWIRHASCGNSTRGPSGTRGPAGLRHAAPIYDPALALRSEGTDWPLITRRGRGPQAAGRWGPAGPRTRRLSGGPIRGGGDRLCWTTAGPAGSRGSTRCRGQRDRLVRAAERYGPDSATARVSQRLRAAAALGAGIALAGSAAPIPKPSACVSRRAWIRCNPARDRW